MLRTETFIRDDGVTLVRTYSDARRLILQNETGVLYDEAVDVENSGYTYTESNQMNTDETLTAEEALDILMGGDGDGETDA